MLLLLTLTALQIWALSCCRYNCIQRFWHVAHESLTLHILLGACSACSSVLHLPPQLHHPWNLAVQELETPLQLPFLAESGDPLVTLRAAAIVKEHWIYMFNLDESPATCDILSPFACSYKAKVSAEGVSTMKTLSVKHVAWSRKLGKDFLPKGLLNNRFYARSKTAVILKQDDKYFSCTPQLSRSGPWRHYCQQCKSNLVCPLSRWSLFQMRGQAVHNSSKPPSARKAASARHLVRQADLCMCAFLSASCIAPSTSMHTVCSLQMLPLHTAWHIYKTNAMCSTASRQGFLQSI